tara:strand:- start:441 stop:644 length:204 start_codon:yes stop_codon:yes gene_type:complete
MLLGYNTKKELKEHVGQPLRYTETSLFGAEYKPTGTFVGANRPAITKTGREFFAEVTMLDNIIIKVK